MSGLPALSASETAALQEFVAAARAMLGPALKSARLWHPAVTDENRRRNALDELSRADTCLLEARARWAA